MLNLKPSKQPYVKTRSINNAFGGDDFGKYW